MDNRLIEAEKAIASKDAIINLLKQQLSKLEEGYKNNLKQTEKFRYKFCVTSEQLRKMKISGTFQNQKYVKPIRFPSTLEVDAKKIEILQQNIEENNKLLHVLLHHLDAKNYTKKPCTDYQDSQTVVKKVNSKSSELVIMKDSLYRNIKKNNEDLGEKVKFLEKLIPRLCLNKKNSEDGTNNEREENQFEFFNINKKIDKLAESIEDLKIVIKKNYETYKKTLKAKSCQCFNDSTVKLEEKNKQDCLIKNTDFNSAIPAEKGYDFLECNCPTKDTDVEPNNEYESIQTSVILKCICSTDHLNHCIQPFKEKNQKLKISMTSQLETFKEKPNSFNSKPRNKNDKHCQTLAPCTASKSLLQNASNSPVTSDEEVKIEDIYKAVSFACGYKQPKPVSEPTFGAKTYIAQRFCSNNDTTDSSSSQSVCTNCSSLEKKCEGKSPMSNLQIYVDYLHEQLSIISNIEDQIQNMKCETNK